MSDVKTGSPDHWWDHMDKEWRLVEAGGPVKSGVSYLIYRKDSEQKQKECNLHMVSSIAEHSISPYQESLIG